jgi:glycerol-3-phosphate dehydrogenase
MASVPACSIDTRARSIAEFERGSLDVLVLGGGINGAGVIRDLALRNRISGRNLRLGLIERTHFGSGTSGRNSHLIHGGLRYLKYFDFSLVREALRERSILLDIAPHLVEPMQFLLPFHSRWQQVFHSTGLILYDLLAGRYKIGKHFGVPLRDLARLEPEMRIADFSACAAFMDCSVQSGRLVLANIFEAVRNGVSAANYVEALEWTRIGDHWRLHMRDQENGREFEVRAQTLVDATGAWTQSGAVRLVRGSHLILPRLNRSDSAIAYFESSGRIIFFIPWGSEEQCTLLGTTDVEHTGNVNDVRISDEEVQYLLSIARRVFRDEAVGEPISSFSSLRPLVADETKPATAVSRSHRIWKDSDGIVRITGGKYTTYRLMSEEAADLAFPELAHIHVTHSTPVDGNSREAIESLLRNAADEAIQRVVRTYGVQTPALLDWMRSEGEAAPIAFAAHHEMAQHLKDVMYVSTTWGYEHRWDEPTLRGYAAALGKHLGWTEEQACSEAASIL